MHPVFLLCCLAAPQLLRAQGCMLVPVPLAQRTAQAALVVEARVASQQPERAPNGHLVTRHVLEVYKVFRGQLPAGPLSVLTPGGFLGEQGEVVSGSLALQTGQQGIFFLEADPNLPGERRAYAGPQGFIEYNLATLMASEPFGRYASIGGALYGALAAQTGVSYRNVVPNAGLAAATQRRAARTAAGPLGIAAPTISSFSPSVVTAGTSTTTTTSTTGVLTISGSGFGTTQGTGFVQFANADDGGATYTQPLANDYLSWSDSQIQVRVPSYSAAGHPAGTGAFQVALDNSGSLIATSPTPLTVTYALLNVVNAGNTYRVHLISPDGSGGYSLQYAASFPAAAKAPFELAIASWRNQTAMNRTAATPASPPADITKANSVSVVRFAGSAELPAGVLGVTNSYYSGCSVNSGPLNWQVTETDYAYAPVPYPGYTWNFTAQTPSNTEFDFQSIALHELGHGEQLTHIISPNAVMHYAIANGQLKRALDMSIDVAAGNNVIGYSVGTTAAERCNNPAFMASPQPLPVVLMAFAARYQPGQGTRLSWATATEAGSLAFVVESQDDPTAGTWQEVARVAAAGSSPTPRQYASLDARPLAGTRYYRLRQMDLDGRVAYSPVAAVTAATMLAAYPNPAARLVRLSGPLATDAAAHVRLLDATGRCVASATGPVGQAAFDLPLAGVPAGLYIVEWDGGAGRGYLRLVVE
ncbi:hypothetical protein A0257_01375 [Hymenobacter psoromatis]|nr:hypothetical protein A0257_01375 [Hymenobacter psoromatis]